jgi:polysaccharide deacetylase 2 family uncharacterized protein YibQ
MLRTILAGRVRIALAGSLVAIVGTVALGAIGPRRTPPAPEFKTETSPLASETPTEMPVAEQHGFVHVELMPPADALALLPAAGRPLPQDEPAWLRNAVPVPHPQGRPMIAVVVDDLGLDRRNADRVASLPGPLTLAFLTYADDVAVQARAARAAGHELLVHVPMEPVDHGLTPGFNVLRPDLSPDELRRRIDWALSRFDGYVGINNHMGSRFTADDAAMSALFAELHRRGLLFLDSRTTAATVGDAEAARYDVPFARRNVFLDNESSADAVWSQLTRVEEEARRAGFAVAIGHPHDGTIDALQRWLPTLAVRGFALVPVSAIAKQNLNREVAARLFFGPESPVDPPRRQ